MAASNQFASIQPHQDKGGRIDSQALGMLKGAYICGIPTSVLPFINIDVKIIPKDLLEAMETRSGRSVPSQWDWCRTHSQVCAAATPTPMPIQDRTQLDTGSQLDARVKSCDTSFFNRNISCGLVR